MKSTFFAAFLLFSTFPASLSAQYAHDDLKSGKRKVSSLLLMPVEVQLTKVSMKGGEPMMAESMAAQRSLTPIISQALEKHGYRVDQNTLLPSALEKDTELRYTVDDLQKKFDELLKQMERKSKDVRKGRFSLGDDVAKVPAGENADAFLFVRASGEVLTGGKKTFGVLVGGQKFDEVRMFFGIVDSRTGDVLYFAKPYMLRNLAAKPEKTGGDIDRAFKEFIKLSPAIAR